jgi:hypothetical protein
MDVSKRYKLALLQFYDIGQGEKGSVVYVKFNLGTFLILKIQKLLNIRSYR